MKMRLPEAETHLLDKFADPLALLLVQRTNLLDQIGIELNL
jgi:hypothetical protein